MLHIFVDADACPVKQEVYRVAKRYRLHVTLVANSWMRVPDEEGIVLQVVGSGFDAADDWIAEHVQAHDIVVTADIPLASRCLKEGAHVIGPSGKPFTETNIGEALATRDLLAELRSAGEMIGGPPPLKKRDRSLFLQKLNEVIQAILRKHPCNSTEHLSGHPWFEISKSEYHKKHAIIVGAGIAGIITGWTLAKRGWQIDLIEQHGEITQEGSGNPMGILMPRISLKESTESEFYASAFIKALCVMAHLKKEDSSFSWQQRGALQLASSKRILKQIEKLHCSDDFVQAVSAEVASEIAGVPIKCKALYFPMAGCLNPADLCERLIKSSGGRIKVHFNTEIRCLRPQGEHWELFDQNDRLKLESEVVVLANAAHVTQFQQTNWLPLTPVRGQISIKSATEKSKNIRCPICYEGYVLPETDGVHVIGATFARRDRGTEIRKEDHTENLKQLEKWFSGIFDCNEADLKGRAAVRAVSPDRMPLVGPVPNIHYFKTHYHDIHKGKAASSYPRAQYLKGLYLNVGHGAKGLCSSFLSAELIASLISNEPLVVSNAVQHALNPSRFIIRNLQKRKKIL